METKKQAIGAIFAAVAVVGMDAQATRDSGVALFDSFQRIGVTSEPTIRFGIGGDVESYAVGAAGVAADASTQIRHLDSDVDMATAVFGSLGEEKPAIMTPEAPRPAEGLPTHTSYYDRFAADRAMIGQKTAEDTRKYLLSAAFRPQRAENRMKSEGAERELYCLSEAIYYEARGETVEGQIAVGEVIMNRVDSRHYPNTVCGVVRQGEKRRNSCQFSYRCDGAPERMADKKAAKLARDVALRLMKGERRGLARDATHYHATYVKPYWAKSLTRTVTHGTHVFYR